RLTNAKRPGHPFRWPGRSTFAGCAAPVRAVSALGGKDADRLAAAAAAELDGAVDEAEQRVVLALADVLAGVELRAALTDEDGSGGDLGAAEHLHAEALRVRVATVAGGTATFGLGHRGLLAIGFEVDGPVRR